MSRNKWTTRPYQIQDGDSVAIKVVAVAGTNNDWAAYEGPTTWSDEQVASQGDKLAKNQVGKLFHVMSASGRRYRDD